MKDSPRVLLTIDYEPWFALTRRYDAVTGLQARKELDGGFSLNVLEPILALLHGNPITFFLVGEIVDWYPDVPGLILDGGHELGFHCQEHRSLTQPNELRRDLISSRSWREQYNVIGYRAPMVGIDSAGYKLLRAEGFEYSSSIYAPTGSIHKHDGITEIPVSTAAYGSLPKSYSAPRPFNFNLLLNREIPFGSSFTIGANPKFVLNRVDQELKQGLSPVIILHPYEIIAPTSFGRKMLPDLIKSPQLLPFMKNKSNFLNQLLRNFPTGTMRDSLGGLA